VVFFLILCYIFYVDLGGDAMENIEYYLQFGKGDSESIYIATLKDDTRYIVRYYQNGNDIHIVDGRQQTLLHLATRNRAIHALELLLKLGVDPNLGDKYQDTPLHIAAFMGSTELVERLLSYHANPNAINSKNETPLHKGAFKGDLSIIQLLLDNGSNIHAFDERQTSVLQNAIRSKKIKAIKLLIEAGAIVDSYDVQHQSTAHYLALYATKEIAKYLIDYGINPYSKNQYDLTPLHMAVEHPDHEMVNVFIGSGLTSYDKSKFGQSPFDVAREKHKFEAEELFNKLKNDHQYQSKIKTNQLTFAIVRNKYDLAESLIEYSDVNRKDIFNNTPLFYAIMNKEVFLVKHLLEKDASVYNIDNKEMDAIYYASLINNSEIFKLILSKTINLDKKYLGYTIIELISHLEYHDLLTIYQKNQE
jgi:ankyrin repeat protein